MIIAIRRWRGVSTRFRRCGAGGSTPPMPGVPTEARRARPTGRSADRRPRKSEHLRWCLRAGPAHKRERGLGAGRGRMSSEHHSSGREQAVGPARMLSGSTDRRRRARRPGVHLVQVELIGKSPSVGILEKHSVPGALARDGPSECPAEGVILRTSGTAGTSPPAQGSRSSKDERGNPWGNPDCQTRADWSQPDRNVTALDLRKHNSTRPRGPETTGRGFSSADARQTDRTAARPLPRHR